MQAFGVPVAEIVEVRQTPDGIRIDKAWVAAGVGRVLDPVNFENLTKGGLDLRPCPCDELRDYLFGRHGGADELRQFRGMRMPQAPVIEVRAIEGMGRVRGIGEPPVPPAAAALANAIFAATGQRIRELPLSRSVDFG